MNINSLTPVSFNDALLLPVNTKLLFCSSPTNCKFSIKTGVYINRLDVNNEIRDTVHSTSNYHIEDMSETRNGGWSIFLDPNPETKRHYSYDIGIK